MEKKYIYYPFMALAMTVALSSCDDFLDEMPDNRTELDTEAKITNLLVSAYPETNYALLAEMASDNTDDNGGTWTAYNKLQEEAALWKDVTDKDSDSPYNLWNDCYKAIASANAALDAINEKGNPASLDPQRGEALMCRAYNHFILVNIFSKAYSPKTSTKDLGIPYMTHLETTVSPEYTRGTVAEVYEKIAADIEAGLPLLNDAIYTVPKYHFNKKAGYAFAARFYLYYVKDDKSNYDKAIQYATVVLTENPTAMLRDWATVGALSPNNSIRATAFINVSEKANLLLYSTNSSWGRIHGPYGLGEKFSHNDMIANKETCKTNSIWGSYSMLYFRIPSYQGMPKVIMGKIAEYFEITDPVNDIGQVHVMFPALTTDEVILNRAEAYTMKGEYTKAAADLDTWIHVFTKSTNTVTVESVNALYGEYSETTGTGMKFYTPKAPTPKKVLHPDFTVESGTQENFIHAILHVRRILTLHEGLRWFDIKRYGLEIYRRTVYNNEITVNDEMKVDDPRRAIQLPQSVITAGLEANPRN